MFRLESLASLATIAGLVISILALLQSRAWLALIGLCVVCLAIAAVLYARKQRLAITSASTVIEGYSIDSLNVANLRRRVNRTFVIQEAHHRVEFEGEDMKITWKYSGYCRMAGESAMEFSIDSDTSTSFESLGCIAYDLGHDPEMAHAIHPLLIGTDGISKKISVPLLEPLGGHESFSVLLKCTLPRCVKPGLGYYISTLSFDQDRVPRCVVHLIFNGTAPSWMRVYECKLPKAVLLKSLAPVRQEGNIREYMDVAEERQGQSARVYMFWRGSA